MCCKYLCIFSVFIYALCMCQYFCRNCFNLRFKIDVVVMIIWSIVIVINSVLTLQVSTASLPHDREPCEIKVVFNHTCLLHTCVCAGSRRVRVCLSGFRWQGISSTPGGFLKCPGSVPTSTKLLRLQDTPPGNPWNIPVLGIEYNICSISVIRRDTWWTDGWINGWMDGWMDGRMDGWTDGRMDGWTDGRMDGRTDGRTDEHVNL